MSFFRRWLGGEAAPAGGSPDEAPRRDGASAEVGADVDDEMIDEPPTDELIARQVRYARYAWTPPAQGGERRADDDVDPPEGR